MKRQIKFRAWDGKEMHHAGVFQFSQFPETLPPFQPQDSTHFFPFDGIESGEMICGDAVTKVALMQFTGLKDQDGQSIYEGDIVETRFRFHGKPSETVFNSVIVYNEDFGMWQISYRNITNGYASDEVGTKYFVKVIGNICENPDLMKP